MQAEIASPDSERLPQALQGLKGIFTSGYFPTTLDPKQNWGNAGRQHFLDSIENKESQSSNKLTVGEWKTYTTLSLRFSQSKLRFLTMRHPDEENFPKQPVSRWHQLMEADTALESDLFHPV